MAEIILLNRISKLFQVPVRISSDFNRNWVPTLVSTFLEIVEKYRRLNGCIFICFLDASSSKAFDRIKHSVLLSASLCVSDGAIHSRIPFM